MTNTVAELAKRWLQAHSRKTLSEIESRVLQSAIDRQAGFEGHQRCAHRSEP